MKTLTEQDVLQILRDLVAERGTQYSVANEIGVTPAYLSDVLRGARKPANKILEYLHLREEKIYKPK